MEKEEKTLVGQATPEQIEAWKREHGDVYAITVDEGVLYVRKRKRRDLSYASSAAAKKGGLDYIEAVMKNCKLGGDDSIITDDAKFMGASGQMATLIDIKEAELKKL
jgi:hypothetical protein